MDQESHKIESESNFTEETDNRDKQFKDTIKDLSNKNTTLMHQMEQIHAELQHTKSQIESKDSEIEVLQDTLKTA